MAHEGQRAPILRMRRRFDLDVHGDDGDPARSRSSIRLIHLARANENASREANANGVLASSTRQGGADLLTTSRTLNKVAPPSAGLMASFAYTHGTLHSVCAVLLQAVASRPWRPQALSLFLRSFLLCVLLLSLTLCNARSSPSKPLP